MNQGIVQSSLVQQIAATGGPNWWNINNNMQPSAPHQHHSLLAALPHNHIAHHLTPPLIAPPSWTDSQDLPDSWSQLVLGLVGEENKPTMSHMQPKIQENWEQLHLNQTSNTCCGDKKQEISASSYSFYPGNVEFQAAKSTNCLPQQMFSSPSKSCITTSSKEDVIFGFSNKSSEVSVKCKNSTAAGGAPKKARIEPSSAKSGIKVRKEKLGDRISALHQLVSPFGKTDTASVLLEAIGYVRFLQRQIETLSQSYLNSGSRNMRRQQSAVLDENNMKRKAISEQGCDEEPKKDLRSRGLCLVPISCTIGHIESENGADYWAPAFGGNFH